MDFPQITVNKITINWTLTCQQVLCYFTILTLLFPLFIISISEKIQIICYWSSKLILWTVAHILIYIRIDNRGACTTG